MRDEVHGWNDTGVDGYAAKQTPRKAQSSKQETSRVGSTAQDEILEGDKATRAGIPRIRAISPKFKNIYLK